MIDDPDGEVGPGEPFEVLRPEDLGLDGDEVRRRATMYTAHAFCSGLKPNLLLALLRKEGGPVILLDADGCVYAGLDPVAELAERHSVVVTPTSFDPHPNIDDYLPERTLLMGAPMNGGFLAVGGGGEAFLEWWGERTRRHSIYLRQAGLAYSEAWLTLVPAFFDHLVLRDDRGCNVSGGNLHAREVEWDGDVPTIEGGPLRHFHFFASFDPDRPHLLAPFQASDRGWMPLPAEQPGLERLCRDYASRLLAHGYRDDRATAYRYASAPDGTPIEPWVRELYRSALVEAEAAGEAEPPNPFSHEPAEFLRWVEARAKDADAEADPVSPLPDGNLGDVGRAMVERERLLRDQEARREEVEMWRDASDAWQAGAEGWQAEAERWRAEAESWRAEAERRRAQPEGSMGSRITRPLRAVSAAARRARALRTQRR